jgi:FlaA1/EpsC-like NDP-sugar epimerase
MGVTKRIAEQIVRSRRPDRGAYVSVRFGNVLGSSGSVVPLFMEQIQRGGPVTVSHPGMERFFMTASEACGLVLQAGALQATTLAAGQDILALDMGAPLNITDLAQDLIRFSGQKIDIAFTGPRPGEKLSEDLAGEAETLVPTRDPHVYGIAAEPVPRVQLDRSLAELRQAISARRVDSLMSALCRLVPDYTRTAGDLVAGVV